MIEQEVKVMVNAHTYYPVGAKCECGEFLMARKYGILSPRDAWEQHFVEILVREIK